MKNLSYYTLCFVVLGLCIAEVALAQANRKIHTIEEAYAHYPRRIDQLLSALDLEHDGLRQVKDAVKRKRPVEACKALLAYYRHAETAEYLRRDQPASSSTVSFAADSILKDIFTFYDLPDRVPRKNHGGLDWTYKGPDDDIEWAWGLNRHGHLLILLESYFETGNPVYARTIDDHVQDWVMSSLPYPAVKSSTPQWRGLEVALRAKVWVRIFFALVNSEHMTPATRILMLASLPDHTHYMRNFHAPAGNWLTMEMSGLAVVATAWPEFNQSKEWVAYAKEKMLEGLKDQVYPDGVQKELTSHYHQVAWYNFDHFREICEQANEPLPADYTTQLEKMQHYTAYTVRPSGFGILNNDSDKRYNRDHIIEAASHFDRDDWLFIATNGKKGKRPAGPPSVIFPWAGQLIMRSGYDADAQWAFFDMGPWGTGHQHNDKMHFSITAYGRDLLVDGGRFAYRGALADKFRAYATGSASHNVLLIDGAGQDAGPRVTTSPLSEDDYKISEQFDYARSEFDRFKDVSGNSKHNRAVFYVRGKFWIIADRVETDRPRKVEALWHWHPDVTVKIGDNNIVSTDHERGNLSIIPVGQTDWNIQLVKGQEQPSPQGWYSEKYNRTEPSVASIYTTEIRNSSSFVWVLFPTEGQAAPLKTEILSADAEKISVRISDERSNKWEVVVPFSNSGLANYVYTSGNERLLKPDLHGAIDTADVDTLLSRLDMERRVLEKVRAARHDPARAASELLAYYRARRNIKHPVDRSARKKMVGKSAEETDLAVAEDAMKHMFVGQRAYPPYYCGDDIDWETRPVPDNEWVWQLNRMGFWDAMARAYWHTGNEKYAREWALQLLDWTQKNPRDADHAYAWRSIEAGIRGYRWMELFQRFLDSPSFTPQVLTAFLNSCHEHASYLMTKYRKGSNWALMEAEGLAFISIIFPEFREAGKWMTEAIARLNHEMTSQVYPDGHQRELAIGYHTGSIGWFQRTLDLATMNGIKNAFPQSYRERIEKMCEVPFKFGLPDGTTTQFGDSWQGKPGHLWPLLKQYAARYDRPDFLYVATQGREGKKPSETAFPLEHSGFYSFRSGWDSTAICLVLKCGPDGGGHCQPDNGTFELYAGGRNLMPDAGSYIYSGDPEGRAWFRQTKVHQTLTLNGGNSAYAPKNLLWKTGEKLDVLVVENASYPDLTHRRAVFFVDKKFFVIVDEARGQATGDVDIHFQLAPSSALFDTAQYAVRTDFANGWNVMVKCMPQEGLQLNEEEGWVSYVYTQKEPRPAFRYRLKKQSAEPVRFVTIVAPYEGTVPPEIGAEIIGHPAVGPSRLDLKITADAVMKNIHYEIAD